MSEARYRPGFKPKRNGKYVKRTRDDGVDGTKGRAVYPRLPTHNREDDPFPPRNSGQGTPDEKGE